MRNEIKFKIHIPNPFKSIADAYRQKRLYVKELNTIYEKMALAEDNKELDFLIAKKEQLESALGVGMPKFKGPPPPPIR